MRMRPQALPGVNRPALFWPQKPPGGSQQRVWERCDGMHPTHNRTRNSAHPLSTSCSVPCTCALNSMPCLSFPLLPAENGVPMPQQVRAVLVGYSLVAALLVAVVVSGYWAFGAAVNPLVLDSIARPAGLVVAGNAMVVLNSLAGYLVS